MRSLPRSGLLPIVLGFLVVISLISPPARATAGPDSPTETITELRVHGNQALADAEVLALAGVTVGDVVGPGMLQSVERRLLDSGRFELVEVRKRYRSLTAAETVAVIVVVRERAAPAMSNPVARVFGEFGRQAMFLPILDYTEGYGVTFGARTSFVDILGSDTRVSVPATWGGEKRVALETDTLFETGVVHRLQSRLSLSRRENPHFEVEDDRTGLWARVDRRLPFHLRVAAEGGWQDVRFGALDDTLTNLRVALDFDTRSDPTFPRDAVLLRAAYEWLEVSGADRVIGRPSYRVEAYAGLIGQSVLAVRADYQGADAPLPPYEQPMLGGGSTLRGWQVGEFIGDRRVSGSAELRFPLNSPLSVGRMGGTVFFDTGTVYDVGEALGDSRFRHGAGAGLFLQVPLVRLRLDVAHNLVDSVRVHLAATLSF